MSTVHLNPTAARECRSNKTVHWPCPPLTLAIHFHFTRPNASESKAKQNGGGDLTHRWARSPEGVRVAVERLCDNALRWWPEWANPTRGEGWLLRSPSRNPSSTDLVVAPWRRIRHGCPLSQLLGYHYAELRRWAENGGGSERFSFPASTADLAWRTR
jgi:hypothetical protein